MNNIVTLQSGQPVTTTLAISEGTGNEHKSIIQLVRTYKTDLEEFGRVAFEMRPFETVGGQQEREIAILNEQQSTLILTYMRNSDIVRQFKKALVKAFYELMKAPAPDPMKLLGDPAAMRGLLLNYTEKVIALEETVKVLEPKADAFDLIAAGEDAITLTEAAKVIGIKRDTLTARLHAEGWIYRLNKAWVAYDKYIKNGYLRYKEAKYTSESTGQEAIKPYCHVTPKGLSKLALLLSH